MVVNDYLGCYADFDRDGIESFDKTNMKKMLTKIFQD